MADLYEITQFGGDWGGTYVSMNLWCPPCGKVHAIALADIEKLVYELNRMASEETRGGYEDDRDCYLLTLEYSDESDKQVAARKAAS